MTKRRLENEIDDASEAILEELSPDERLELIFTASGKNNDDRLDRVQETCPRRRYRLRDQEYMRQLQFAYTLALQAVYDLHTTGLLFESTLSRHRFTAAVGFKTDLSPEELGVTDEAWTPGTLLWHLSASYEGYERFAEEELGVPVATWLSVHPTGQEVARSVAEVLEEHEGLLGIVEEEFAGNDERVPVEELADRSYQGLREMWEEV